MADATIPTNQNALPRRPLTAHQPYTVQIDPLLPTQYGTPDRPVKVILHTGGPLFVRPGPTCQIDDTNADIIGTGQYINTTPNTDHLITVNPDTDATVSFIRRP